MTVIRFVLLAMLGIILPAVTIAANDNIRFLSTAEIEVSQLDANGKQVVVRQPAKLVVPGSIVIYTNSYTNEGTAPAQNMVITNPIPDQMEFLAGSTLPGSAAMTYSIDGGQTYATPDQLIITATDGSKRIAEAKEYTHIRWQIQDPLPVGETEQVEFRARLK